VPDRGAVVDVESAAHRVRERYRLTAIRSSTLCTAAGTGNFVGALFSK
jgi:hypothetical protein